MELSEEGDLNMKFVEIVISYPQFCVYEEYKGKPYFSIKYTENGQEFIGFGTYSLEVLSEYLRSYFMTPPIVPYEDCISRKEAINELKLAYFNKDLQGAKNDPCIVDAMTDWAIRTIKNLPSVEGADMREVKE